MAQIRFDNSIGEFVSAVGDSVVSDISDFDEIQEIVEEEVQEENLDVVEAQEDILDSVESDSVEDQEEIETSESDSSGDYSVMPMSVVDSGYSFSPQTWQVNLAAARSMGEHYLMYGIRRSSSGYYSYWDYYLALGDDIEYNESTDVYDYTNCDFYHYSSIDDVITYEVYESSGSISGSDHVVYSDLYFDYVGVDPVNNSGFFVCWTMLFFIFLAVLIGGRRNV